MIEYHDEDQELRKQIAQDYYAFGGSHHNDKQQEPREEIAPYSFSYFQYSYKN